MPPPPPHDYNTFYMTTSMRKRLNENAKREIIQHFCFCLGLRSGAILSSVWWLISGLIFSIYLFYTLNDQTVHTIVKPLAITFALESAMIFFVALFGLNALVTRNTVPAIRLYLHLALVFMVGLWSLLSVSTLIVSFVHKEQYQEACPSNCENRWKSGIIELVVETVLTNVFNVYFVMILHVYIKRRETRLKLFQKNQEKRHTQGSITSSTNFSRPASITSFSDISTSLSKFRPQFQPPFRPQSKPPRPQSQPPPRPQSQLPLRPQRLQRVNSAHRPRSMVYMSSYNPNNIVINRETISSYFRETDEESDSSNSNGHYPSVEGDATSVGHRNSSPVVSSYNNLDQNRSSTASSYNNLDQNRSSTASSYNNLDRQRLSYEQHPQYTLNGEVEEHNLESLLGTMDITDYDH